jgi:ATP-binding cassette subfamily B (MDR/TAP) protein 1
MDPKTKELHEAIQNAVKDFDPNAEERDESLEFYETETVTFWEMMTRFADGCDKVLMFIGFFWSFLFGSAMPGFCLVFGGLVDDLGSQQPGTGNNPM